MTTNPLRIPPTIFPKNIAVKNIDYSVRQTLYPSDLIGNIINVINVSGVSPSLTMPSNSNILPFFASAQQSGAMFQMTVITDSTTPITVSYDNGSLTLNSTISLLNIRMVTFSPLVLDISSAPIDYTSTSALFPTVSTVDYNLRQVLTASDFNSQIINVINVPTGSPQLGLGGTGVMASLFTSSQATGTTKTWVINTDRVPLTVVSSTGAFNSYTKTTLNSTSSDLHIQLNSYSPISVGTNLNNGDTYPMWNRASTNLGAMAGFTGQASGCVAIGYQAGYSGQGTNSIAIGYQAAISGQSAYSVAIGYQAGMTGQRAYSVAIGYQAGITGQATGSIAICATGAPLIPHQAGLYVVPVRAVNVGAGANVVGYDTDNKEIYVNSGKTFVIQHPVKEDKLLVHACLEGPEAGVYQRGESEIKEKSVVVELPEYFSKLAKECSVQLTALSDELDEPVILSSSRVEGNKFTVKASRPCKFFWHVTGTRIEVDVERDKSVVVRGFGPYTYCEN